jgi:hypothetical protein
MAVASMTDKSAVGGGKPPAAEQPDAIARRSPWLRHVFSDNPPEFTGLDVVQIRLEEEVARIALAIERAYPDEIPSPEVARSWAVNLLMEQALVLQRQHSPGGYKTMLSHLVTWDPDVATFRNSMGVAALKSAQEKFAARRMAFLAAGCFIGISIGVALSALIWIVLNASSLLG